MNIDIIIMNNNSWTANKIYMGNGCYKYKCKYTNCSKPRKIHEKNDYNYNVSIYSDYCSHHYKTQNMHNTIIID